MSNRFFPAAAIIAVVAGLIAVAYSGGSRQAAESKEAGATTSGPRIQVPAVTLPRADGGTFSSVALRGKSPLILSFFATWCGPCRQELPELVALYQKHRAEGLHVAMITTEDAAIARRFAKEQSLPFPVLIDADGAVSVQFQASSIPTTVALDRQGRAAAMSQGYSPDLFHQIETVTAQLVKE